MASSRGLWPWLAASALVLALVWLALRRPGEPARAFARPEVAADPAGMQVREPAAGPNEAPEADAEPGEAPRSAVEEPAAAETEPATPAGGCALELEFTDPSGETLSVSHSVLVATWDGGSRRIELADSQGTLVEGLPPTPVTLEVAAAGHRHAPQTFEPCAGEQPSHERIVLWPDGWVAVVVRDGRGRAFTSLADDLGIEPKRLFVDAFDVRSRRAPPLPGDEAPDVEPPSRFVRPGVYQTYELPGSAVGALVRQEPGAHWVGLALYGGAPFWQHLSADATEIEFELGSADLDARFAELRLRIVDAGGAPVSGARTTLKADTSAHRRSAQMKVPSDDEGRVAFDDVVPGEYELLVETDTALHQQRFWLATGERRDLGDVTLVAAQPIALRVVDEQGGPVWAWIEVGPLVPGSRTDDLYPPNLHRMTDREGRFELPMPSTLSMLRAQRAGAPSALPDGTLSPNVAIDPKLPPGGEIVLVIADMPELAFEVAGDMGARVEVLDALGVIVAQCERESSGFRTVELPPGSYEARIVDPDGSELARRALELRDTRVVLRLP